MTPDAGAYARQELRLNPKEFGRRLGSNTQTVITAHNAGEWTVDGDRVTVGGIELLDGEYRFDLVSNVEGAAATLPGNSGVVVLDTTVTPELEREGVARDLVRLIQQARRNADLNISDRISLSLTASSMWVDAFNEHRDLVMGETLTAQVAAHTDDSLSEPQIEVSATTGATS